jgi:rhodanese-related sulfurtransferase
VDLSIARRHLHAIRMQDGTRIAGGFPIMGLHPGAVVAFVFLSLLGYLFWRGTVVVMKGRRLVDGGALFVDVGTPKEFLAAHLANAMNIPSRDVVRRIEEFGPRSRAIVLYARSGLASARSAFRLRLLGYRFVTNVGPMKRWDVPRSKRWMGDTFPELIGDIE